MQPTLNRVRGISLRQILPDARFIGVDDIRVTSCTGDSRNVQPGDLFAAMIGDDVDGHDYAQDALQRGATGIVAERLLPISLPTCMVRDTRQAYGRICQALAGNPSERMRTIGVTGTNGKTVTSLLIASVLEQNGHPIGLTNSLAYSDSIHSTAATQTTPAPPQLARWLARSEANGCSYAVVEASSVGLARHRLAGVELDAAVLTNVRQRHLDLHGSLVNYRRVKKRIFQHLRPHGFAVINADDPASKYILSKLNHPVLTVGMKTPAEISAHIVERHSSEQTFLLSAGSETVPVRTRMIGDHHVYNCLSAAAVGLVYGMDLADIAIGLERVENVPGRLERIECGQPFGVFVDRAGTPDTLAVALKTLRRLARGRVICVYGAEGEQEAHDRPALGRVVERGADIGILTSNNPRNEEPLQIAHDVLDGYERPAKAHILPDRAAAIELALSQARPGDMVLLAGKGEEDVQVIDGRILPHSDGEVARRWLYATAPATIPFAAGA